ncbi:zinc finger protein 692 isoform X2 [Octodon degus]|uniref:Zinc finger protein 692 n=1 Tax=Octodon degus TaxID=10160 RepID=A0A6P6D9J4_OCTDE|nr:zinc finger protein 692 isoform X2 [Octodon degus]
MASAPAEEEEAARGRRERRRRLDARRSKCRIRLGGRMERWCHLKERLGFALHSQLATFLLDRYLSSGCTFCAGPEPLSSKSLQCLVLLCHAHSRECGLAPELRGPAGRGALLWECSAGHSFSWEPPLSPVPVGAPQQAWSSEQEPTAGNVSSRTLVVEEERQPGLVGECVRGSRPGWKTYQDVCKRRMKVPPASRAGPTPRGLQPERDGATPEIGLPGGVGPQPETFPPPREEEEEEEMLSDASPWSYSSSPDGSEPDVSGPPTAPATHTPEEAKAPAASTAAEPSPVVSPLHLGAPPISEAEVQLQPRGTLQAKPVASPRRQAFSTPTLAPDEDAAQIVPKRIRKAAKRELLPCDFPGCGRIFSNRQYLNHHKKYQHIHQKSFCCPEPACGKSFNFKKHLKEHVKLHSDTRDYICEFCARSFRTSSNLVIHRRIHTGEKPLQCEICGFTCRQKASLNWHRRRHSETAAALRFPCEFCGKRFEKPDSVAAHRSKSHPALQVSLGPTESCAALCTSEALGSHEGSRPLPAPQAPASPGPQSCPPLSSMALWHLSGRSPQ